MTPDYDFEDEFEEDEGDGEGLEEDCHGWFDGVGNAAVFVCGAVGSEDCDECSCHEWLGLTPKQIDDLEGFPFG